MSALRKSEEDVVRLHSEDDLQSYADTLAGHGPQHESVIEVERDDDLTSIRSKLEEVRAPRAVLVIPPDAKALREGLEFRVLRRLQRELGLEMVIISSSLNRRAMAQENGFRNIFGSLKAYYGSRRVVVSGTDVVSFTEPEEFTPAFSIGKWGVVVGAILAAILAVVAYFALPAATVEVYPETRTLTRDVEVLVELGGPRIDTTAQRLAGRLVEERVQVQDIINVKDVAGSPPPASGSLQSGGLQSGVNVTLQVRDALRDRLLAQATAEAVQKVKAQLQGNESLPEAAIHTTVVSESYDHNIGDASPTLSGTIQVSTTGLVFNNDDFNRLVFSLWSQDVPRGFKAVGEPNLTPPSVVSAEGQHLTLRVRAEGKVQAEVSTDAIAAAVRGRSVLDAQREVAKLADFPRPPRVTLWPDWASQAFRVQIRVNTTDTAATSQQ